MKRQLKGEEGQKLNKFDWKRHRLIFGEMCPVKPDPKHSDCWREAYESHTSERAGSPTFNNTINGELSQCPSQNLEPPSWNSII